MEKNKIGKYLKYAIGEILLVVIGILLALQINTWNELRKDAASELTALLDLKQEFSKNTKVFNEHHQFKQSISQTWIDFIANISNRNLIDINQLTTPVRPGARTYNPSRSILNSILSTGKIDKVENDSLKYFLTNWNDILLDYAEDEARHLDFWDKEITPLERTLIPYRYYNLDSIDTKKNDFYTEIETKKMIFEAYDNLEYQNILLRNVYFLQENVKSGALILETYNSINKLLDEEIKLKKSNY
ncbi:MAG: hypothetical protein DA407_03840 [Bacteroidetes bacterium]|nr:MAG: hypothetical protein DA407_03840 [Bacteroidota bacterium]